MKTRVTRIVVVTTTVLFGLLLVPSSTSATSYSASVLAGDLVLTTTGLTTATIPLIAGAGCPGQTLTLDLTPTAIDVTVWTGQQSFTFGTGQYVAVTTRLASTPGSISGTTATSLAVTLSTDIFLLNLTTTTCNTTGTRICRLTTTPTFNGLITGTTTSHAGGVDASTATVTTSPPCGTPFTAFNGGTSEVINLTFHIT